MSLPLSIPFASAPAALCASGSILAAENMYRNGVHWNIVPKKMELPTAILRTWVAMRAIRIEGLALPIRRRKQITEALTRERMGW